MANLDAKRRELTLKRAAIRSRKSAPHLDGLFKLVSQHMPLNPLASDSIHSSSPSSGKVSIIRAISDSQWISFNNSDFTNVITIDIDHARWPHLIEYLPCYGCPLPTFVVADAYTGRCHATWVLANPVRTYPGALEKPNGTLGLVRAWLNKALDGDPAFTNRLTKSPWYVGSKKGRKGTSPEFPTILEAQQASDTGLYWHTIIMNPEPVGLMALVNAAHAWETDTGERIPPPPCPWFTPKSADIDISPKGSRLFDASRYSVYNLAHRDGAAARDLTCIRAIVDEEADRLGSPATDRGRERIARSIHKFMTERYGRRLTKRIVMPKIGPRGIDPSLPLIEKQRLSVQRTNAIRKSTTDAKIAAAIDDLQAEGLPLTQAAIAARAGVCIRSVRNRLTAMQLEVDAGLQAHTTITSRQHAVQPYPLVPTLVPAQAAARVTPSLPSLPSALVIHPSSPDNLASINFGPRVAVHRPKTDYPTEKELTDHEPHHTG
jgi:hypothetical protein